METVGPRLKWTRSQKGWVAGVCQGLGESFAINPGMIRLMWIASILFFGFGLFLYLVCAFCLPVQGNEQRNHENAFLGVCRRLAERLDLETGLVRVLTVFLLFGSFGTVTIVYFILHFALSETKHDPLF